MNKPKGKLIIIGGSVDRGSFSESIEDLNRSLKFFEKGILKRITTESVHDNLSRIEIITTASSIPEDVGGEYIKAFAQLSNFILARDAYACRVQSFRRPDAAEKGNNVALIAVHGPFEGSVAIAASERVTLIQ